MTEEEREKEILNLKRFNFEIIKFSKPFRGEDFNFAIIDKATGKSALVNYCQYWRDKSPRFCFESSGDFDKFFYIDFAKRNLYSQIKKIEAPQNVFVPTRKKIIAWLDYIFQVDELIKSEIVKVKERERQFNKTVDGLKEQFKNNSITEVNGRIFFESKLLRLTAFKSEFTFNYELFSYRDINFVKFAEAVLNYETAEAEAREERTR